MDKTLKTLFRYIKRENCDPTWRAIRDNVLAEIYHRDMRFTDVVKVLLTTYTHALMEPRFEMPGRHNASEDLLLAPIKGHHAIDFLGANSVDAHYTVEQFYGAIIDKMMGDLRCCRIDWCQSEIWPEVTASVPSAPSLAVG